MKNAYPILLILSLLPAGALTAGGLKEAVLDGDIAEVNRLIQEGADVNLPDESGSMTLHHAAFNNHTEIARLLIKNGAGLEAVEGEFGYTPLHIATRAGWEEMAALLLAAGADVRAETKNGNTPLLYAVQEECRSLEEIYRRHGGDRPGRGARDTSTPANAFWGHWLAALPGSEREESEFFFGKNGTVNELRTGGLIIQYAWELARYDENHKIVTLRMDDDPDDGVHVMMTGSFGDGYNHFMGYLTFRATSFEGKVTLLADDEHSVDENWETNRVLITMTYIGPSAPPPETEKREMCCPWFSPEWMEYFYQEMN
ncbi:MAG: ankyrin repeat domain-containing protein [PVC group bacterium]